MKYCSIVSCEYNKRKCDVRLFRIPNITELHQKWIDAIKTLCGIELRGTFLICQLHFNENDLCLQGNKYVLKRDAVPTIGCKPAVQANPIIKTEEATNVEIERKSNPNAGGHNVWIRNPPNTTLYPYNSRRETDTAKEPKYCVECIQQTVTISKYINTTKTFREQCQKLKLENQILRAQLKYINDKYFTTGIVAKMHKMDKIETIENDKIERCETCCVLLPLDELRQHLCSNANEVVCEYCSRSFKTTIDYGSHLANTQIDHKTKLYKCTDCTVGFPAAQLLKFHQESDMTHAQDVDSDLDDSPVNKWFSCALCDSSFELPKQLAAHMQENHPNKKVMLQYNPRPEKEQRSNRFECHICKRELNTFREVKSHLKQHVAARDKKCVVCNEFLTSNELSEHMCFSNRSISCEYCDGEFLATCELLQHIASDHEERILYKCRKCGKFYTSNNLRQLHEKTHTETSQPFPFICEICSKGFSDSIKLKTHAITHSDKRDFLCCECGKGFKTSIELKRHGYSHNKKELKCPDCPVTFRNPIAYRKHRECHLNLKYNCDECGKKSVSKRGLLGHINRVHRGKNDRKKKFECSFCFMMFESIGRLNIHVRKHTGEKPFECQYCEKKYAYKQDILKHLERDHQKTSLYHCKLCSKGFRRLLELTRHCCEAFKKQAAMMGIETVTEQKL